MEPHAFADFSLLRVCQDDIGYLRPAANELDIVCTTPLVGRYILIRRYDDRAMVLCEVQPFAEETGRCRGFDICVFKIVSHCSG